MYLKFLFLIITVLFISCENDSSTEPISDSGLVASKIEVMSFQSASLQGKSLSVNVYLPKGYKSADAKIKHKWMIWLHGSSGHSHMSMTDILKPVADELIASGEIPPVVLVMPNFQHGSEPSFSNRHLYANSEYFGKYEDAITKDMIQWLKSENKQSLAGKLLFERKSMGISGFSMGGDGALRIGFRNPDLFIAIGAHGAAPSFEKKLLEQFIVPAVLTENMNSRDANGNYTYVYTKANLTQAVYGVSAAFSPLLNGNIRFLLTPAGKIDESLHAFLLLNGDCKTIINTHQSFSANGNLFLYLEVGSGDSFLVFNNYFVNTELPSIGIPQNAYVYTISSGGHGFDHARAKASLKWLILKME